MNTNQKTMTKLRVGVVGARRAQQGIGEHVARFLAQFGADVRGIVGTRQQTVDETRAHLQSRYNIDARGYLDLGEMINAEALDAVAICSPFGAHAEQLQTALDAGVHVLCEKPVVFDERGGFAEEATRLIDGFAEAGKWLVVNEQWPYTLPDFQRLYPQVSLGRPIRSLKMALCPASIGPRQLPDALPHVLSLLLTLAPLGGQVAKVQYEQREDEAELAFRYVHRMGQTVVQVAFRQALQQPRPSAYSVNGFAARRVIELPSYNMYFEPVEDVCEAFDLRAECFVEPRRQKLSDPLELLVREFVRRVNSTRRPIRNETAKQSCLLLEEIDQAVRWQQTSGINKSHTSPRGPHKRVARESSQRTHTQ